MESVPVTKSAPLVSGQLRIVSSDSVQLDIPVVCGGCVYLYCPAGIVFWEKAEVFFGMDGYYRLGVSEKDTPKRFSCHFILFYTQ